MTSDLSRMIDQVSREKGVEREVLVNALEEAVKAAARKKYGPDYDLEVNFNDDLGEIEVFEFENFDFPNFIIIIDFKVIILTILFSGSSLYSLF